MRGAPRIPNTKWRKSSYSNEDAQECVEVARRADGAVPVRDSKRPSGPHLALPAPAWSAFLEAVRGRALSG
ncbi:DUF397 domain-containing protein [Streptomyces sp. CA-181903]|uniref:DUF397 domain-containing protein n=1 Tax=Streptomyces sp. CA-181903 TaxID=3240055 RepID=UPI003D8E75C0